MAVTQIPNLPAATSLNGSEQLEAVQSGTSVRVTSQQIANLAPIPTLVSTFSAGSTGLTPSSASSGAVTLNGTLNATHGGTGFATYATGDIIYASASNTLAKLTAGTNGYYLALSGGVPVWAPVTATSGVSTFSAGTTGLTPSTASSGAVTLAGTLNATSGGTGITTYTTGDIVYASATNTLSKLAAGTNGYFLSLSGGVPTWVTAPLNGVTSFSAGSTGFTPSTAANGVVTLSGTLNATSGGTGFATYATGDLVYASATNTLSKLTAGTNGYYLSLSSGVPAWTALPTNVSSFSAGSTGFTPGTATNGVVTLAGTLNATHGGTGLASYTTGDLVYSPSTNTLGTLALGSNGNYLSVSGGVPVWIAPPTTVTTFSGGTTGFTPSTAASGVVTLAGTLNAVNGGTGRSTYARGDILFSSASNTLTTLAATTDGYVLSLSSGIPAWVPAPASGVTTFSAGTTGFTPSTATNGAVTLAGTLNAVNGGTGLTTYATGDIIYASASNTLAKLTAGTNGYVLSMSGGVPTWASVAGTGTVTSVGVSGGTTGLTTSGGPVTNSGTITLAGTLNAVNGGTGLATYATGDILYASATNTLSKLTAGTNGYFLSLAAGVPTWAAVTPTAPAGSSLTLQYNNAGAFGGMSGTSWDDTNRSLTITGATVTTSNPILNLSQTWNNAATTFTGLKLNVTDIASASASLLLDLQVGGVSKFNVAKNGDVYVGANGSINSNSVAGGWYGIAFKALGGAQIGGFGYFGGNVRIDLNGDVFLNRDAANTSAWRNGTAAQTSRVYNTYTDASNGEWGTFDWSTVANTLTIGTKANGTGAARSVSILSATGIVKFGAADAATPVAQTIGVQSVVAGTTNTAGANLTITGSQGTGTGAGGSIIFKVAPAGTTGTAQNALATSFTLYQDKTFGSAGFTVSTLPAA